MTEKVLVPIKEVLVGQSKKMPSRVITFEEADELIRYEAETGLLYWKVSRRGSRRGRAGDVAGWLRPDGNVIVGIRRRLILAHRLVWLLTTKEWPSKEIDHRDGNRSNNRRQNLRLADRNENAKNRKRNANNTSGYKGVTRWKDKWRAEIMADGQSRYLGLFTSPQEAHQAYLKASKVLHGSFARHLNDE